MKTVLLAAIVLMLMPFVVPTTGRILAGLRYRYQIDSEEGFVLWQAWQLRHGRNIFRKLDAPPYVAATYAPLFPAVCAVTLWGKTPSLFSGRLLVALSVGVVCVFMALIVYRETRQILAALLGPLLFLNTSAVYNWLPFYRVDFTALALGMVGLWFLTSDWRTGRGRWRFRAACACFVAMVYTKQVELAPFLAALVYFLFRDRGVAWRLFRNVAAWGLGIAAVLTLATWGQFLVHNVYYNANPFDPWQLKRVLIGHLEDGRRIGGSFYLLNRFHIIAVIVCLIWYVAERFFPHSEWNASGGKPITGHPDKPEPEGDTPDSPPHNRNVCPNESTIHNPQSTTRTLSGAHLGLFAAYAAVASIWILGVGKIGAATNYLIEPKAAWSLFIALVLGKTIRPAESPGGTFYRRPIFFPVVVVLALHAFEFLCSSTLIFMLRPLLQTGSEKSLVARVVQNPAVNRYLNSRWQVLLPPTGIRNPTAQDRINGDRIVATLRQKPEPVFCEHAVYPLLSGREVYIQPFIMKELAQEGKWDQTPVVRDLRNGAFSALVTTEDIMRDGFFFHYTDEMVAAMRHAYRRVETLTGGPRTPVTFSHYIYEPKRPVQP